MPTVVPSPLPCSPPSKALRIPPSIDAHNSSTHLPSLPPSLPPPTPARCMNLSCSYFLILKMSMDGRCRLVMVWTREMRRGREAGSAVQARLRAAAPAPVPPVVFAPAAFAAAFAVGAAPPSPPPSPLPPPPSPPASNITFALPKGSTTTNARSTSLSASIVFLLFFSPNLPTSSTPAVSINLIGPKPCISMMAVFMSEVVPGVASTMLVACWVKAFKHVDLPAFISPTRPMRRRCSPEEWEEE